MIHEYSGPYLDIVGRLHRDLVREGQDVDVGTWHAQDVSGQPHLVSQELRNVIVDFIPAPTVEGLQKQVRPNLPWAEEHFIERISGEPMNPPPSHVLWPWAQHNTRHQDDEAKFSHTYPERYWPKWAGEPWDAREESISVDWEPRHGIRYEYGDLLDVVKMLIDQRHTRQAYLPVWFPEDTGAVHGERVPCSLGYHFLVRRGYLYVNYFLRSCDFRRHFSDDMYHTARLLQWMGNQLHVTIGSMTTFISSLHIFHGDLPAMRKEMERP